MSFPKTIKCYLKNNAFPRGGLAHAIFTNICNGLARDVIFFVVVRKINSVVFI